MKFSQENSVVQMESLDFAQPIRCNAVPRWQRKQAQANEHKTPGKTPRRSGRKTPRPSTTKKKSATKSDRFIPKRSNMNMDFCRYSMTCDEEFLRAEDQDDSTSSYRKSLAVNLLGQSSDSTSGHRVLAFRNKAPAPPEDFQAAINKAYAYTKPAVKKQFKPSRHIQSTPTRILDAPELMDDYYLNLISWSCNNVLAVALGQAVFLWDANTGSIEELMTCNEDDYISSVSWMEAGGNHIAIGTSDSKVQLWDVTTGKELRRMGGHQSRVGALAWNKHILSSGSRDSTIINHDVRIRDHGVSTLTRHRQEVCGLKWSPDGHMLASGGNDNLLCLWDSAPSTTGTQNPLYTMTDHTAAVKALDWCPWERNLLASGGGTADRTIKFWNAGNGALLNSKDTGSQVCSLLWSHTEKELLSSHGFSQNELCLWKYPTMTKVKELHGHTARVLHLAASPDGSSVVSAAADETLRFWNVFAPARSKEISSASRSNSFASMAGIR